MTKKEVIKALQNKKTNPFYFNDSLYECLYCSVVQHNDTIKELKQQLKDIRSDKNFWGDCYEEKIAEVKQQLKEIKKKRSDLQKASALLVGDSFADYND